ncbi:MAG: alkaline phosphatase family protein, partial [Methanosarcinales archaeon]
MYNYSLVDIAPTIARLIKVPLPKTDGTVITEVLDYAKNSNKVILIIIDSFDYCTYKRLKEYLPNIKKIEKNGLLIFLKSVSEHTTPAIASIFCGYYPDFHKIYETGDVFNSNIKSILEIASNFGIKSAIIIESKGALAMKPKIDVAIGVDTIKDIMNYDNQIKKFTIKVLKEHSPKIIATHFRAIDRYAHENRTWKDIIYAAKNIDKHIGDILNCINNAIVMICGDHTIHWKKKTVAEKYVPLIIGKK